MLKGLMLLNNQIEDVESLATKGLLTRAGFKIDTFTLEEQLLIETAFHTNVLVDYYIDEINVQDYDFLVLPGGKHVFNFIGKSSKLKKIITKFNDENKLIAAICAAPLFLNEVGLLKNKKFVAFPSVVNSIEGSYQPTSKVVLDGNIITARSAGTVFDFVFKIVEKLKNTETVNELQKEIVY